MFEIFPYTEDYIWLYLSKWGQISYNLALNYSILLYGKVTPHSSDSALKISQGKRECPGGYVILLANWTLPSALT